MSNRDRKARKAAGKKYQPKPAKMPTVAYAPKGEAARNRRASSAWMDRALLRAAAEIRKEEGLD